MTDIPQNNHKPQYEEIETATTNKFLVVGMRPPPETPYVHPNFYLKNQIKLKRRIQPPTLRKRHARSTGRREYADIERDSKGGQTIAVRTDQEEDDYTPHRSRNFHYDEKLGEDRLR
ncbi:hypothetical protein QE152_g36120 [Popillia japonica]|uniref:Uncharacterized protein n=1 Tax=Popillia japonica TaxID=7064 RepID=A0AAW1IE17_POPJA